MQRYSVVVKKRTTVAIPQLNTYGKPLLLGPDGKELPKHPDNPGTYIGTGTQKIERLTPESTDDPLTDDQGNVVTAGSVDALLRKVKEHFSAEEFENVEILEVAVQETLTIKKVTGEELAKL
jgi:hypothetical protein